MATTISSILLATILLSFFSFSATANENNLLVTGEVLSTGSQLSNDASTFVIQGDCNLVLYTYTTSNGFQSNTHGQGLNCKLYLSDYGQLTISREDGSTVWTSPLPPNSIFGKYATVLRADGQVGVYGPSVWSTFMASSGNVTSTPLSSSTNATGVPNRTELLAKATTRNILFTDQILYRNYSQLRTRDYSLVMRDDCNLALEKFSHGDVWDSGVVAAGQDCYAKLNRQGRLVITDIQGQNVLWSNNPISSKEGDYVLVLRVNGHAVIYGPLIWSTDS